MLTESPVRRLAEKFELSRNDGAGNVRPMEGLRGFAVFLVFLVHYTTLMAPWITQHSSMAVAAATIHVVGNVGVDLFFVLSGYLIYGSLMSRQQAYLPFMRRRIVRIYPAFAVVFAIYLVLCFLQPGTSKIPHGNSAAALYILQNILLLPGIFNIEPIITVAWSLSFEMFYYLMLPPLLLVLNMRAKSGTWRCAFFMAMGAAIMIGCAAYNGGPMRLAMFIAGILLYEAMRAKRRAPDAALVLVIVLGGLALQTAPYFSVDVWVAKTLVLMCAFFILCLHCFTQPQSWLTRAFSWAPLRWLGNMSYSYYLLHGLALKIITMALFAIVPTAQHPTALILAALPIAFLLTLVPTAALFLLIERPFSLHQRGRANAPLPTADKALG